MPVDQAELAELLQRLLDSSVQFVLVGGAAAVIHGAPITTQDIDVVHDRDPGNVDRLMRVLAALDARVVDPAGRQLVPQRAALLGKGQSLVRTRLGRIDLLGALHDGRGFADLLPTAVTVDLAGRPLRVIDLHALIEIKSGTGRAKDRLMVPVLLELARVAAGEQERRARTFHPLAPETDLHDGYLRSFEVTGVDLVLVQQGGVPAVLEGICPHAGHAFARSRIVGTDIRCDMHAYRFDLRSGACTYYTEGPCRALRVYECGVRDGWVGVWLPATAGVTGDAAVRA